MSSLSRSALLPYSSDDVFTVVSDVARYHEFLPWCCESTVLERDEHVITARLEFRARGLHERLTTRNTLVPTECIRVSLVSGPFVEFDGQWRFAPVGGAAGCRVTFELKYRIAARHLVLAPFVGHAADRLVDAFAERCAELLG